MEDLRKTQEKPVGKKLYQVVQAVFTGIRPVFGPFRLSLVRGSTLSDVMLGHRKIRMSQQWMDVNCFYTGIKKHRGVGKADFVTGEIGNSQFTAIFL